MQAQTALSAALKDAGVRTPVHKKMNLSDGQSMALTIVSLVKPIPQLAPSAEAYERFEKRGGRKVFNQQGNIKLGETITSLYLPTSVRIVDGAGSKGDRLRVIFTMGRRGVVHELSPSNLRDQLMSTLGQ